jgi:branched-chain amino acid transport system ATP-binding protein
MNTALLEILGRPRLFLIDEMSLGLAPLIVDDLIEIVTSINARGATVLLVEQDVQLALENSNYAYVLETGRIVREAPSSRLLQDRDIKNISPRANPEVSFRRSPE